MNQSEDTSILDAALSKFQDESGFVKATKENPFLKNKYADYNTIVSKCRPKLKEQGLQVKQLLTNVEGVAAVYTQLKHLESKQFYSGVSPLTHKDHDPQAQGSAITYMKRYSYVAILDLLVDADDDGNIANGLKKSKDKSNEQQSTEFYTAKANMIRELRTKGLVMDDIAALTKKTLNKQKMETIEEVEKVYQAAGL